MDTVFFSDEGAFGTWLDENHATGRESTLIGSSAGGEKIPRYDIGRKK